MIFPVPTAIEPCFPLMMGAARSFRNALPVLARHRFTATQFLVADAIGGTNHWDVRNHGEAPDALMDTAEVRDWISAGQEIGSHTLTHPVLTAIQAAQAKEEIFASKKKLEDLFGVRIRHFCYPYGRWSRRLRDLVEEAVYATAVTLDSGVNAEIRDPFALRRIGAKHPPEAFATSPHWRPRDSRFGSSGNASQSFPRGRTAAFLLLPGPRQLSMRLSRRRGHCPVGPLLCPQRSAPFAV